MPNDTTAASVTHARTRTRRNDIRAGLRHEWGVSARPPRCARSDATTAAVMRPNARCDPECIRTLDSIRRFVLLSYDNRQRMRFHVNFQSGKAVYLQLVDQVRTAAAAGAVRAGEALPTIRGLAEQLRVNRNTVAKAYAELESQGIIETAVGRG